MAKTGDLAIERFLARLLSRSSLTEEEQSAILDIRGHMITVSAHRDIVLDAVASSACLVVDGLVARFDQMADGLRQITSFYIAGDVCDLHSVVSPTAGLGLQAMTQTTVLRIRHSDLRTLAIKHPAIAFAFWRDTAADASVLAKWVSNLGRRDARARLAHLFCELGYRMEAAGLGSRAVFPLPITQIYLADAVGLTPVHVNRTLQSMRHDGLVVTEDRYVHIQHWNELASVAEFDPDFLLLERKNHT